ncbi:NRDE family protein [Bordetella sp. 02P26C-1]|uniref:NRDE family protein n=1 Tax=Bordetella sp. 02P26C-1 TaxID=2683195 RepID=UPI001352B192|nr:NRDE family protein [Bordetella sp. 02P26C-1]MVW80009.1 hypothetical protein [Bordetella sp. 02P26C-1]
MCLAVFAVRHVPGVPVLIAANRDEFHARPAQAAGAWPGQPRLYAGRDLRGGGTWMGVNEFGRYAILTNVRDPRRLLVDAPSRGALVETFLRGDLDPMAYLADVHARGARYNGFNLIVGDPEQAAYYSNHEGIPRQLPPGVYAVSNHLLDTPWPKLRRTRSAFVRLLGGTVQPDLTGLYAMLADRTPAIDSELPCTGIPLARERLLSSPFIVSPDYGTRASTVLALHADGRGELHERQFNAAGEAVGDSDLTFAWRA